MKLHEIKITIDMLVEKCPRIHLYISLTDLKKKRKYSSSEQNNNNRKNHSGTKG